MTVFNDLPRLGAVIAISIVAVAYTHSCKKSRYAKTRQKMLSPSKGGGELCIKRTKQTGKIVRN